jgi:hypothetical protein
MGDACDELFGLFHPSLSLPCRGEASGEMNSGVSLASSHVQPTG